MVKTAAMRISFDTGLGLRRLSRWKLLRAEELLMELSERQQCLDVASVTPKIATILPF